MDMNDKEQIYQFGNELDNLVDRFRQEYEMSYAAIVGTLHIKAHLLCSEAAEDEPEESA